MAAQSTPQVAARLGGVAGPAALLRMLDCLCIFPFSVGLSIFSACFEALAAALDPSLDVVDGAFPVASAIDIWARDPPAVRTLPARSA